MPVDVRREAPGSPAFESRIVRRLGERMLAELELVDAELSVLLTNDATIHELNREHRSKDRPTDVLAFPQDDEAFASESGEARLLGDVVISLDTAEVQAGRRGVRLVDEVAFLLAHGLLHLAGYDHQNDADEKRMDARTKELVACVLNAS
jgi:probable rRNA maturation factor